VNLKTAILVRRLRQTDLVSRLGIPSSALSEAIHGLRIPNAQLRTRMAEELHAEEESSFPEASDSVNLCHLRNSVLGAYRLAKRRRGGSVDGLFAYPLRSLDLPLCAQAELSFFADVLL
jgi:transcriptional regulator with XRE-family HTH domain